MIVKYTTKEKELLARLMRAEAVGEGDLGMLMVGNVGINRVLADCLTFKDIRTISEMVYQSPGGFSGTSSSLFYGNPTAKESELAERVIRGEYYYPATNALWFYAPKVELVVLVLGGDRILPVNIKIIAFINQILEYVKRYINDKFYKRFYYRYW